MTLECAPLWFEYGNALLIKEEDADDGLLKATNIDPQDVDTDSHQVTEAENVLQGNPTNEITEENEEEEKEDADGDETEDVEDLQIAWEALEVSRKIFTDSLSATQETKNDVNETKRFLALVYLRLGDLQMINGAYQKAIEDYADCIRLREELCPQHDECLSGVYFAMAMAYIYSCSNNSENEGDNTEVVKDNAVVADIKSKACSFYRLARQSIESWIKLAKNLIDSSNDIERQKLEEEISFKQENVDELLENEECLEKEIEILQKENSSSKSPAIVTTVGFETSTLSTNDYFLQSSNNINMLQVITL